jgi:hypothetical protein
MTSPAALLTALASMAVFTVGGTPLQADAPSQSRGKARNPAQVERVHIQANVNLQRIAVQPDGSLAPWSSADATAEQFDLYDVGNGLLALKSVANGKYVTAARSEPLRASGPSIGAEQIFRRVGAAGDLLRLRAADARSFVCAAEGGLSPMTATTRCPHEWQLLRIAPVQAAPVAITAPAPGSTLVTTGVTFQWTGPGDEFWLDIGSAPGASDLYASGSLGQQNQHTVNGLPLNGMTLHVQLRVRIGALTDAVRVQYQAAIRKGLLVITDFADRRLEDWTGAGMQTVDDIRVQLREMEAHFAWLSRGLECIQWDIIRVQLPEPAVPGAYPWWGAFRDAVGTLVREQVVVADYDVNSDDTIDAAWLIVSSGDAPIGDFAIGGASRNAGVNMFVDGQASVSVISRATGNFNHELGHLLGLPDMYGPYDTIHGLTVMSFSWPVPPHDFAAYERLKLGWLRPHVLTETTRGVWLPSAHDVLAGVMIPTARWNEYFLIEYRRRPDSGYGSQNPPFNGLAVYHVLEGSSMFQDPPIVKLEPADGSIKPGGPLDPADFVYPGNPGLLQPMVLRSYYGSAPEVFRLENVFWRDDGIAFDIVIAEREPAPVNLLVNPSFETGQDGSPDGWSTGSYVTAGAAFVWPSAVAIDGERSAQLEASTGNDMWWSQTVSTLVPGEAYQLCGSLKGEEIHGTQGHVGGNVSLLGGFVRSEGLWGTFDWTRRCVNFVAATPRVDAACRLGFYGSTMSGKLWCDNLTLERLEPLRSAF